MGGGGHQREDKVVIPSSFFMSLSGKGMQQECFGSNYFFFSTKSISALVPFLPEAKD